MNIKIKLFDESLPLPQAHSEGAAGIDLYARLDTLVPSREIVNIPLNVAVQIPSGYWVLLVPRSSTQKLGLMAANSVGIIDSDYCGDGDEYLFAAYNFTDNPVVIAKGQRIAQMILMPSLSPHIEHVDTLSASNRGGFGSTSK